MVRHEKLLPVVSDHRSLLCSQPLNKLSDLRLIAGIEPAIKRTQAAPRYAAEQPERMRALVPLPKRWIVRS